MSEPVSRSEFDELVESMRLLERRVCHLEGEARALERAPAVEAAPVVEVHAQASGAAVMTHPGEGAEPVNAAPVLGKALLALAGAYLLRALTESGAIPLSAGAGLGVLYAMGWLGMAARCPVGKRFEALMYSVTAVLILTPLLWESVVRFQALPRPLAAAALVIFTVLGLTISWRRNLAHVAWVATLGGVLTLMGLLLATHDLAPFMFGLLAIAAAVELSACLEHWLHERWPVAAAADVAVLIATYIATRSGGVPEGYASLSPAAVVGAQLALLGIYLASAMTRTLWRELPFRNLEALQCAAAFALAVGGGLRVAQGSPAMIAVLSGICLLFGAASYLVSLALLEGRGKRGRNFHIYSTFGFLLVVAGAGIVLPPLQLGATLPLAALLFFYLTARWRRRTLLWHATAFLVLSMLLSGGWTAAFASIVHGGASPAWTAPAWICVAAALAACLGLQRSAPADSTGARAAVFVVTTVCAVLAVGAASVLLAALPADAAAVPRTALVLGAAMVLAWFAQRQSRPETGWAVYPLLALAAYKFLMVDFAGGNTMTQVGSLALFGVTMLLLPRYLKPRAG